MSARQPAAKKLLCHRTETSAVEPRPAPRRGRLGRRDRHVERTAPARRAGTSGKRLMTCLNTLISFLPLSP